MARSACDIEESNSRANAQATEKLERAFLEILRKHRVIARLSGGLESAWLAIGLCKGLEDALLGLFPQLKGSDLRGAPTADDRWRVGGILPKRSGSSVRLSSSRPAQAAETQRPYESSTSRTFRSSDAAVKGLLRKLTCSSNTPCRTMVSFV